MSDEKRQTRLLPFRLRRAGAGRRGAARRAFGDADDVSADAELTALLRAWEAPPASPEARGRLLADFRASAARPPFWRRALTAELRVPLPVAACAALALLVSLFALGTRPPPQAATAAASGPTPAAVRVVEVPVVEERVVTRTVYVEKKERGGARGVSTWAAGREALAAVPAARRAGAPPVAEPAPEADSSAGYFTRVDMNDFEPADEVKIRIVKRGSVDER